MYEIGMAKAIQIDDADNVATVASEVSKGERVEVLSPDGSVLMIGGFDCPECDPSFSGFGD